ncbi:MAG: DUF2064 domain-containing protein [Planctomycetota bacterium]
MFARYPTPGQTKTRLAAAIGAEPAAGVAAAMGETTLRRLAGGWAEKERVVAVTPPDSLERFRRVRPIVEGRWHVVAQPQGDLGERMRWWFDEVAGGRPALLLGSDCPHFPAAAVGDGIEWLAAAGGAESRAVVAPADDGGYWAIGVAGDPPPVFDGLPWSDPDLLAATVERLDNWRASGRGDYRLLDRSYDVDTAAELDRLRRDLLEIDDAELERLRDRLDGVLGPLDEPREA